MRRTQRMVKRAGRLIAAGGLSALAASFSGCADYPTTVHGYRGTVWPAMPPTLIIRNESGSAVRVFPWLGRVDAFDPSGASDFNRKNIFDVPAGCEHRVSLGVPHEPTASVDGIVRFGILELDENGRAPRDHESNTRWFEFEQPHPYDLRVSGEMGALEYESIGEGGLVELAGAVGAG